MTGLALTEVITVICAIVAAGAAITVLMTVRVLHKLVNSRMTQLLALTEATAHAEGVKESDDRQARERDQAVSSRSTSANGMMHGK